MAQNDYDTTLARIAGNIASGMVGDVFTYSREAVADRAVLLAEAIVKRCRQSPSSGGVTNAGPTLTNAPSQR